MIKTFELAPYRDYTQGDINALKDTLNWNEINVLHSIQKWDRFGKGANGCYALVETIASDADLTSGQVRNIIHRLHQKGYVALLGPPKGYPSLMARRVTLPGIKAKRPKVLRRLDAGEINALAKAANIPGHVRVREVLLIEVPTVEEIRAERSMYTSQNEMGSSQLPREAETHREDKQKIKDNPPSAGCSFSSSPDQTSEVSCPESIDDLPAEPSHKKNDWKGMVEAQPFKEILNKRFPGYSDIEAKLLMNLVKRKGVSPAFIGFVLQNLGYVSREPEFKQPARPTTLDGFCRHFFALQEITLRETRERGVHDMSFELAQYDENPKDVVEESWKLLVNLDSKGHGYLKFDPHSWTQERELRSRFLWPDLAYFAKKWGVIGYALKCLLPEGDQEHLLCQLGCHAAGAEEVCNSLGLNFEDTFGWSYSHVVIEGRKRKERLLAEHALHTNPERWTPNSKFSKQRPV